MVSARGAVPFYQIDVFAERAGAGNPLAVVLDAGHLSDAQMQSIAAWLNLAETTFVLPPEDPSADYRVRIFTTRREIAFAGHPSIGTAHAVLAAGLAKPRDGLLMQQCQAGLLPIRVQADDALSVRVPRSRIVRYAEAGDVLLRRILAEGGAGFTASASAENDTGSITPALAESGAGLTAPVLVEGGRRWWLAELRDEASVRGFRAGNRAIAELAQQTQSLGLCVFARCRGQAYDLVVRAFPLGVGIVEDPASGAANAAIAAFLDEAGALGELGTSFRVSQGREIGRDATLLLHIDTDREVWVGGHSQTVVRAQLDW